jgi:L-serine/L-threonine ammonia-lyase
MEFAIQTPLKTLNLHERQFFLKMESDQPSGSFKLRGMETLLKHQSDHGIREFVSASAGNAGYSAAHVLHELNSKLTVIVPKGSSKKITDLIKSKNAQVIEHGKAWPEANLKALELVKETGAYYIPPYDQPLLWEGHSSMVDEIVTQMPAKPDAAVVAVGGGGLFCGLMQGLERHGWDDIPVICCETLGASALNKSLTANKLLPVEKIETIAASLGANKIAQRAFEYLGSHSIKSHVIDDRKAALACKQFYDLTNIWVEPACGTSLDVIFNNEYSDYQNVLVIVCGGIGWSAEQSENFLV